MTPARLATQRVKLGPGFTAVSLRHALGPMDPFVAVDHFRMSQDTFAPHPHAGFSAVTYLFDDSETGLVSRDSLGGAWPVAAGGLHWTLAGRGVLHHEVPAVTGRTAHGLQMFVNLPAAQKQRAPAVLSLAAAQMPRRQGDGWREVQVFGGAAPLALPVLAALCVVQVEAGAAYGAATAAGAQGFVMVVSGSGRAADGALAPGDVLLLQGTHTLRAATPMVLAVFSGRPLREPVVQAGPFVMNTEAEIVAAMQRFQTGGMGHLAPAA